LKRRLQQALAVVRVVHRLQTKRQRSVVSMLSWG
jgi:hypothetical protein